PAFGLPKPHRPDARERRVTASALRPYASPPPAADDGSRSLVLGRPASPLATLVRGPRAREARDGCPLASCRLPPLLELALPRWSPRRAGAAGCDRRA